MKNSFPTIVLVCSCICSYAQVQIGWQKSYGGSNFEKAYSAIQTTDGAYIVVGEATSTDGDVVGNPQDHNSAWILKLNQSGDTIWTKCFPDAGTAYNVKEISDGCVISCSSFTLLKLSSSGEVSWSKSLGESSFLDDAYALCLTSDGGYIAGGSLWGGRDGFGTNEWFIAKYNQSGDTIWTMCYEDFMAGSCYSIKETSDGNFIAAGSKSLFTEISPGTYTINEQYLLVKFSNNGDTLWTKTFGGSGDDIAYSVTETSDGGYMLAGSCGSEEMTKGEEDGWVIKTDNNGNFQWEKFYGGSSYDQIYSMNKTNDDGYILCGHSISGDGDLPDDYRGPDYWLVKINDSGKIIWSKCFGGTDQDYGQYAFQTTDGGYLAVGRSWSDDGNVTENKGYEDFWIIKLTTNSSAINELFSKNPPLKIYPNFVNNELLIDPGLKGKKIISIYTLDGKLIKQEIADSGINNINLNGLDKGIYVIKLINHNVAYLNKFVKM